MIDLISTNREQSEVGKVWVGLDSCPASATIFLGTLVFGEFYLCSVKPYLEDRTVSSVLPALSFKHQFSSVQWLSRGTPWTAARQASLSITNSWSLLKLMSIKSVISSNHLILCRPLLFPPSIFPSIRVFSNESAFASGGQSIGASTLASVLPVNTCFGFSQMRIHFERYPSYLMTGCSKIRSRFWPQIIPLETLQTGN